jgi:hypothetical protein
MSPAQAKYYPLQVYLAAQTGGRVTLTFAEIEAIVGAALPPTATLRRFWANATYGSAHARAWQAAGWRVVEFRPEQRRVTFVRREAPR